MNHERQKNITFQHMETLIALFEERSFSRAAQKMQLTQPALTKNISCIEDCLNVKVANRSNTGIYPTQAGKILYTYALRMIRLRQEVAEKIQNLHEDTGGDIYLGASTIPATYFLPSAMSAFKKVHNEIRPFIKTVDSGSVVDMVLNKEVELGIIAGSKNVQSIPGRCWRNLSFCVKKDRLHAMCLNPG